MAPQSVGVGVVAAEVECAAEDEREASDWHDAVRSEFGRPFGAVDVEGKLTGLDLVAD